MPSVIQLDKVSKIYPMGETSFCALENVSLTINSGEFVSIVGPSGSGKSTLMHIIGLLDRPTDGKVLLEDHDVSKMSADAVADLRNKHIGFVFQSFNLLARTSALDNVILPLMYAGLQPSERIIRAEKALMQVGLTDKFKNHPSQLSGGQQQRVAIARALVNNPSLILADEPTGNLDSKSGTEVMKLLETINKKGNTVVLVTHDFDLAKKARRTIEIRDGKIVADRRTRK